jgi:hippurate hydrolase
VAYAAAAMSDAPAPEVELKSGGAAIVNQQALVDRTVAAWEKSFGPGQVVKVPAMTASEDFSQYIIEGVPGMFFFTGVYQPAAVAEAAKPGGKPVAFNHSPQYAPVPEPSIKTAIQAMSVAVMNVLKP